MIKKVLALLAVLTLVAFVACKKEETNIDAGGTDTATTVSSSETMSMTDTVAVDTMSTDTSGTGMMSTDTSGTGGTMSTDTMGTGGTGTSGTSTTSSTTTHT